MIQTYIDVPLCDVNESQRVVNELLMGYGLGYMVIPCSDIGLTL